MLAQASGIHVDLAVRLLRIPRLELRVLF